MRTIFYSITLLCVFCSKLCAFDYCDPEDVQKELMYAEKDLSDALGVASSTQKTLTHHYKLQTELDQLCLQLHALKREGVRLHEESDRRKKQWFRYNHKSEEARRLEVQIEEVDMKLQKMNSEMEGNAKRLYEKSSLLSRRNGKESPYILANYNYLEACDAKTGKLIADKSVLTVYKFNFEPSSDGYEIQKEGGDQPQFLTPVLINRILSSKSSKGVNKSQIRATFSRKSSLSGMDEKMVNALRSLDGLILDPEARDALAKYLFAVEHYQRSKLLIGFCQASEATKSAGELIKDIDTLMVNDSVRDYKGPIAPEESNASSSTGSSVKGK